MRIKALLSIMWGLFGIVYLNLVAEIGNRWIADGHRVIAEMGEASQRERLAELKFQKYLDSHKPKYQPFKRPQGRSLKEREEEFKTLSPSLVTVIDSGASTPDN